MERRYAIKSTLTKDDIRVFRKRMKLSRKELAFFLGVSERTIEGWEITDKEITGPIAPLMSIVLNHPELIDEYRIPEQKFPLRLFFEENGKVNTVIDVNLITREVSFKNFTNDVTRCAFGAKTKATFADYEYFLETRCFPRERDKMRIQLEMLNLPFYDPLMIIEKTEGRMADDPFTVRVKRGYK